MPRILVNFAHPALEKSRVNASLLNALQQMEGVTVNELYEHYPDFFIDVEREKALLSEHDVIIFHHPFYWYSAPALLKQWQDLVLEHGWAYGSKGKALLGKITFNVVTTGGGEAAYQPEGFNRFTIRQFLAPFEQTARLCSMKYLPPYVIHGTHRLSEEDIRQHVEDCIRVIKAFRDGLADIEGMESKNYLNNLILTNKSGIHAQ